MGVTTHFHLMTSDPSDGQVKFEKIICSSGKNPVERTLSIPPLRGMYLTLDEPNLKKYVVWNAHLKLLKDKQLLEVELLDPDETSVYHKFR